LLGTIALVFGLTTLVGDGAPHTVRPSLAVAAGLTFGAITFALAWLGLQARNNKALTGAQTMLGLIAVVSAPITPGSEGQVAVRGEIWRAASTQPMAVSDRAVVTAMRGLLLTVEPAPLADLRKV
jgi:membrane-bound serine protease (ClpP class)